MRGAKYRALTAQQIKPEGWLLRQLEIQAEGLSGHLDLVWPDVRESKWIRRKQGRLGARTVLAGRFYPAGISAGR